MERILEPEYMDTVEESQSYDAMDHSEANESFVASFLGAGGGKCTKVLDIGTGPGHIPVLLAQRSPFVSIKAVDAARTMLDIARQKIEAENLGARIELHTADAKKLQFGDGEFDGVISNTILHHIPDPVPFLREAGRVLRSSNATLVIRDLCRPATTDDAQRLVDLHAAECDDRQKKLFYDSLLAALTLDEARHALDEAGLADATLEMTSDRHYTITLRR